MKKLFLSSFLIFAISLKVNSSFSQSTGNQSSDSSRTKDKVKNSLKSGQWALTFGIGSNFTLTNFNGAMIAGKYQFSSKSALRLDFNLDYANEENTSESYTSYQNRSYGGNFSFLYCINPKNKFNVYFSLGVNYQYNYSFYGQLSNYEESRWLTGPKAGAGTEFFVFQSMSIFAEYNYVLGFGKSERTQSYGINIQTENIDITRFRSEYLTFGLSVYF